VRHLVIIVNKWYTFIVGRGLALNKKGLINEFAQKNNIALIYIFGSQVEAGSDLINGTLRSLNDPLTDVDVGVVFKTSLPGPAEIYVLYSSVFMQLVDIFSPYTLDLVFLQETHSVFQANAICGHCVYFCDQAFKEDFEENVLMRAADFRPFLEKYLDEALEEL
jgi:hypothetical protein